MSKKNTENDSTKKEKGGILGRFYKSVRRVLEPRGATSQSSPEARSTIITQSAPANIDNLQRLGPSDPLFPITLPQVQRVSTSENQNVQNVEPPLVRRASVRTLPAYDGTREDSDSVTGSVASMPILGRRQGTIKPPMIGPRIHRRPSLLPETNSQRKRGTTLPVRPATLNNGSNSTNLAPIADFEEFVESCNSPETSRLKNEHRSQSVRELEKAELLAGERSLESQTSTSEPHLPSPIVENPPNTASLCPATEETSPQEPREPISHAASMPNLIDESRRSSRSRIRGANSESNSGHGSVHHLVMLNRSNQDIDDDHRMEEVEPLPLPNPNQRRPSRTQPPEIAHLFHNKH